MTTSDGYVLTMQRLPRKDAKKVVFFMHGVLDTSLGWVCNGPMGSHAFTAHDSGADVWLGNCRANEGVGDKRRGRAPSDYLRYWAFSVNELGLNDVEGMLRYISMTVSGSDCPGKELHIVAHSLGAAAVLIHLVFPREGSDRSGHGRFRRETVGSGGPNDRATDRSIGATRSPSSNLCIKQVILLAPAGFHSQAPFLALPFLYTVPPLVRLANGLMGAFHAQFGLPADVVPFCLDNTGRSRRAKVALLTCHKKLTLPALLVRSPRTSPPNACTNESQVHPQQTAPIRGLQARDGLPQRAGAQRAFAFIAPSPGQWRLQRLGQGPADAALRRRVHAGHLRPHRRPSDTVHPTAEVRTVRLRLEEIEPPSLRGGRPAGRVCRVRQSR